MVNDIVSSFDQLYLQEKSFRLNLFKNLTTVSQMEESRDNKMYSSGDSGTEQRLRDLKDLEIIRSFRKNNQDFLEIFEKLKLPQHILSQVKERTESLREKEEQLSRKLHM